MYFLEKLIEKEKTSSLCISIYNHTTFDKLQSIEPWLQTKNHDLEHGEIQQTKEDRKKLDGMYEVSSTNNSSRRNLGQRSNLSLTIIHLLFPSVHFMRMLFHLLPFVLVECRQIPRTRRAYAGDTTIRALCSLHEKRST